MRAFLLALRCAVLLIASAWSARAGDAPQPLDPNEVFRVGAHGGLKLLQDVTVDIGADGTVIAHEEGYAGIDGEGHRWVSRRRTINGKELIVFVPDTAPEPAKDGASSLSQVWPVFTPAFGLGPDYHAPGIAALTSDKHVLKVAQELLEAVTKPKDEKSSAEAYTRLQYLHKAVLISASEKTLLPALVAALDSQDLPAIDRIARVIDANEVILGPAKARFASSISVPPRECGLYSVGGDDCRKLAGQLYQEVRDAKDAPSAEVPYRLLVYLRMALVVAAEQHDASYESLAGAIRERNYVEICRLVNGVNAADMLHRALSLGMQGPRAERMQLLLKSVKECKVPLDQKPLVEEMRKTFVDFCDLSKK